MRGVPVALSRAAAALALCLAACNSGGSSGGSSESSENPLSQPWGVDGVASAVSVTALSGQRFEIDFTLQADTDKDVGARIEFSEDLGQTYAAASLDAPYSDSSTYAGSSAGIAHQVVWLAQADLSSLNQQDLVIRVTPYNLSTLDDGQAAVSAAFGIGTSSAPTIDALSSPGGEVGGWFEFTYTVSDGESDFVSIEAEHSVDGGLTYTASTLAGGDGTTSLATSAAGVEHTVLWHVQGDIPEALENDVRFRLRAFDTLTGVYKTTPAFTVRTFAPRVDLLTVNAIPFDQNGATTYRNTSNVDVPFDLTVPTWGFVVWIEASAALSGANLDADGFALNNSRAIGGGAASGGHDAGADFGALLATDAGLGLGTLVVTTAEDFPVGSNTLTATVSDVLGNVSEEVSYTFVASTATAPTLPFDSPEVWHLDFGRDNFTITSSTDSGGSVTVTATETPSGVADFVEDLRVLGLNHASPPPAAVTAGLNAVVRELVKAATIGHLHVLFGRNFDGSDPGGAPDIQFTPTDPGGSVSRIGVGGDDPLPGFTIGRAAFDYQNATTNDNTRVDLGVFTTNVIQFYINSSFTFKSRFDPFIEGRGTPIGFHSEDVTVLDESFDRSAPGNTAAQNARYDDISDAVDGLALVVAVILAHEIGHSVGLVANGAPSPGLFGGESNASFAGPYTTSFHLDTPGNNIMAASISFSGAVASGPNGPFFNELNMAYMQHRLLVE